MARQELTKSKANEYRQASKKRKGEILDILCEDTGWSRDNARRQLRRAYLRPPRRFQPDKKVRTHKYSKRAKQVLANAWVLSGCCCGKYLKSQITDGLLERLVKNKELKCSRRNKGGIITSTDSALSEIKQMSPATIDRYLRELRKQLEPLSKSTTKKSSYPLRNEIPFGKSYATLSSPGYLSIDTVAHCGDSLKGEHLWTLNATDVLTGWTETITVKNKARKWIIEGHDDILPAFPFDVIAANYDGGSEFINYEMFDYAVLHNYQMTRSRPYHKNDNAHVEQRNYDIVRKHAFRFRYEGEHAQNILNSLWYWVNLRKNYLVPCRKCIGHTKTKSGRTRGIYDKPKTPYRRCMESDSVSTEAKAELTKNYKRLNDAHVTREINRLQHELLKRTDDEAVLELVDRAIRLAKAA
jgi:hypothetical protein